MTDDARHSDPTRVLARRTLAWLLDVLAFVAAFLVTVVLFGQRFTDQAGSTAIADEASGFRFMDGDATLWFPKGLPGLGNSVLVVPGDKFWLAVGLFWLVLIVDWIIVQGLTGATFGKSLCGLRCVTRERPKPGIGRALVRTLLWVIDLIEIVLPIGFILATFTKGHRRVGDFAGGTFVVDRKFAARLGASGARRDGDTGPERVPSGEVELTGLDEGTDDQYPSVRPAGPAEGPPSVFEPREPDRPAATAGAATGSGAMAAGAGPPERPARTSTPPRSLNPVWNDDLGTYVRWEPSVERWIGWDESGQKWRLVDPSRLG